MLGSLVAIEVRSALKDRIGLHQRQNTKLVEILDQLEQDERSSHVYRYSKDQRRSLGHDGRLCVPWSRNW